MHCDNHSNTNLADSDNRSDMPLRP
ncbi:unnamed protein product [Acanthoscelides obtectus]|uniref:Uncharacterized protein n=1 Tax=Acanthoscelides obtectus TaxID=200917 RepID=A0A9P0QDC9_ACAOB|nr:unnamed protein product [Acanthoscelides obtectus]CAK1667341.1 hypothetical protein AOBTE_LOCUS25786 [Acanthoscelides obtectus]